MGGDGSPAPWGRRPRWTSRRAERLALASRSPSVEGPGSTPGAWRLAPGWHDRAVADRTLSSRALNRALLARQHLLERTTAPPLEVVERLVGLQAQVPSNPYVALWSRIARFDPRDLSRAVASGAAVRAAVIRPTIHLVTLADAQRLAPLNAPVLAGAFRPPFGRRLEQAGVDPAKVAAAGLALLQDHGPLTRVQLSAHLAPRWPAAPAEALAQAVTSLNSVHHVPPRGLWGAGGQATWAPLPPPAGSGGGAAEIDALVVRYLGAFGPAAVADMRVWSRLPGLRAAFERLRADLRTFRDERGGELFDLPGAPRPDPATPAPPRFLPEYDNVLLAHDDRTRIIGTAAPGRLTPTGTWIGHVLIDGFRAGSWQVRADGDAARLGVRHVARTPDVEAEGHALLDLIAPAATRRDMIFA